MAVLRRTTMSYCPTVNAKENESIETQKIGPSSLLSQQRRRKVNERETKRHTLKNVYKKN